MSNRYKLFFGRAALIALVGLCGYQYSLLEQRMNDIAPEPVFELPALSHDSAAATELEPTPSFEEFLHPSEESLDGHVLTHEPDELIDYLAEQSPYVMRFPVSGSLSNVKFFLEDDGLKIFGLNQQRFYTSDKQQNSMLIRIKSFEQTIPLPADADVDHLAHRMEDGHLVVEIPRRLHAQDDLYERTFI